MGQRKARLSTSSNDIEESLTATARITRVVLNDENASEGLHAIERAGAAVKPLIRKSSQGELNEPTLSLIDKLSSQLNESFAQMNGYVDQLKTDLTIEGFDRRKELEEKEQLANSLSTLLEILPAGVIVLDGNGLVTRCNPAAIDLLGEPLEGEGWLDIIKRCFAPRRDDGHEVSLKDGRRVRIETRSIQSDPGQLVLLTDLTETRLLQEQVSRAERLSSLGKMVASLAHQIRTPLSTAMLYAGHLSQPKIDTDTRIECAEKMLARLTHLEHQIRDMLIFAKGETRLAQQVLVADFAENFRSAAEPIVRKTAVNCVWECEVKKAQILCNEEALIGGCINIINNALEAFETIKRKTVVDELLVSLSVNENQKLRIEIKDNGPGIPKELRDDVLEPFYTTKPQGTGLGLAVVKAVVHAHHGELFIESSRRGTKVVIELPVFTTRKTKNP